MNEMARDLWSQNDPAAPATRLVVDLDAIARNWLYLKKKLQNGADCAGVVKADAYGLGAATVARELFVQGCRHFFVAKFDEGMAVQAALAEVAKAFPYSPVSDTPVVVDAPTIYVLEGPRGANDLDFISSGLVPVLNSLPDIFYWSATAAKIGRRLPAIIHIDTGMNRLGLSAAEVASLAADHADIFKALDIRYVMSHLACADEPQHPLNAEQLASFHKLTAALGKPLRYSFANSGGIFLGADYHFDLARPGCAIYGINPTGQSENPMLPVVTFEARILQTRIIDSPATVGYGASYRVAPPAKCATVSIGYADGYLRSLTGKGHVFVRGEKCPVIGRVSMDSIVIDVTHMTVEPTPGDAVEILGAQRLVDDVAAEAGTIGYEILTGLGRRTPRHYIGGHTASEG